MAWNYSKKGLNNSYGPEVTSRGALHDGTDIEATPLPPGYHAKTAHMIDSPQHTSGSDLEVVRQDFEQDGNKEALYPTVDQRRDEPRQICGLTRRTFWILVLAALVIVAAIIAGAVAGAITHNKSSKQEEAATASQIGVNTSPVNTSPTTAPATTMPSSTQSSSQTSSATTSSSPSPTSAPTTSTSFTLPATFVTTGTTGTASPGCLRATPSVYSSPDGGKFDVDCFNTWVNGWSAQNGNGTVRDIATRITYTFEECMDACLEYNINVPPGNYPCKGVTWSANITYSVGQLDANCWLKNATGVDFNAGPLIASGALVSQHNTRRRWWAWR